MGSELVVHQLSIGRMDKLIAELEDFFVFLLLLQFLYLFTPDHLLQSLQTLLPWLSLLFLTVAESFTTYQQNL